MLDVEAIPKVAQLEGELHGIEDIAIEGRNTR